MQHFTAYVAEILHPPLRQVLDAERPNLDEAIACASDERDRFELERAIELGAASDIFTLKVERPLEPLLAAGAELRPSPSGVHVGVSTKPQAEVLLGLAQQARAAIKSLALGPGLGVSLVRKCASAVHGSVAALTIAQNGFADVGGLADCSELVELSLRPNGVKPETLEKLAELPLKRLLVADPVAKALPTLLPTLTDLRRLVLASASLDSSALAPVIATKVTSLDVSGNRLEGADLVGFARMTSLRELAASRIPWDRAASRAVSGLPQLRALSANGCGLTTECLTDIARIPTLVSLDVANTPGLDVRSLASAHQLLRLNITGSGGDLRGIESLTSLRTLLCSSDGLVDAELARLGGLGNLVSLALDRGAITAAGAAHIVALGSLRSLKMTGQRIGSAGVSSLSRLSALRVLVLSSAGLDEGSIQPLQDLSELRVLDIGGNTIGDAGVDLALRLPKLERLYLHVTGTTDAGARRLSKLDRLRELSLVGNRITPATRTLLRKSIPRCRIEYG